jgi:hypothetical protein
MIKKNFWSINKQSYIRTFQDYDRYNSSINKAILEHFKTVFFFSRMVLSIIVNSKAPVIWSNLWFGFDIKFYPI